jgi:hypothetical protein
LPPPARRTAPPAPRGEPRTPPATATAAASFAARAAAHSCPDSAAHAGPRDVAVRRRVQPCGGRHSPRVSPIAAPGGLASAQPPQLQESKEASISVEGQNHAPTRPGWATPTGFCDSRGNTHTHSRMTPTGSPEGWKWVFCRRIPVSQQNPSKPAAWPKPACDWATCTFGKFGGPIWQSSVEFALT